MSEFHYESQFKKARRDNNVLTFMFTILMLIAVAAVFAAHRLGKEQGMNLIQSNFGHFHDSSSTYLRGYRLDLPEEMSVISPGYTYIMSAYKEDSVIYIGFTGVKVKDTNIIPSDSAQYEDYKSDDIINIINDISTVQRLHTQYLRAYNDYQMTKIKTAIYK